MDVQVLSGIADAFGPLAAGNSAHLSREEAQREAIRQWESVGRVGVPAIFHVLGRGEHPMYVAAVIEIGPAESELE